MKLPLNALKKTHTIRAGSKFEKPKTSCNIVKLKV